MNQTANTAIENANNAQNKEDVMQVAENVSAISNNPYIAKQKLQTMQNPYIAQNAPANNADASNADNPKNTSKLAAFFGTSTTQKDMLKGVLVGAVATFILTNEDAQKAIFKSFAKLSSLLEVGVEELKERYEDAKAEVNYSES